MAAEHLASAQSLTTPFGFGAVIFDLDGVVTDTASIHAEAWALMFDECLRRNAVLNSTPFRAFDKVHDYLRYVDGRPRYEGVRSFLESRGIELEDGTPEDSSSRETVCGLGNRKAELFGAILVRDGVRILAETISLARQLRSFEIPLGIASSSRNCTAVLEQAGLLDLFDVCVDGLVAAELRMPGKPAPDIFLECGQRLDVSPDRCVVVEDATVGVEAARAGSFGLVIGMDRFGDGKELLSHGADIVLSDFKNVSPFDIDRWYRRRR